MLADFQKEVVVWIKCSQICRTLVKEDTPEVHQKNEFVCINLKVYSGLLTTYLFSIGIFIHLKGCQNTDAYQIMCYDVPRIAHALSCFMFH